MNPHSQPHGQAQGSERAHGSSPTALPSQLATLADPQARIRQWEAPECTGEASLETSAKLIEDFTEILTDLNKRLKKL